MKKPTIRLMRPAKTESSLIACAFDSLQAIQRGVNMSPCHIECIYRQIFASHTDLIVVFFVRWLSDVVSFLCALAQ